MVQRKRKHEIIFLLNYEKFDESPTSKKTSKIKVSTFSPMQATCAVPWQIPLKVLLASKKYDRGDSC